jgi:DNA repair protein RecN (Recombination protein N)
MFTHIHIQHYSIVDNLDLDFHSGLTVLTGETGAGKSIWVDAVNLALGQRADANLIRHGAERCDISLCFDIQDNQGAKEWLIQNELTAEGECLIRRSIHRNGTTRSTINGIPTPLNLIRELSQLLINIHSQHQSQQLLRREYQQYKLDQLAQAENLSTELVHIAMQWRKVGQELTRLLEKADYREAEMSLLQYQLDELNELNIGENEWVELSRQHQQAHNAAHLMVQVNQALELTVEGDNTTAVNLLQKAISYIDALVIKNSELVSAKQLLESAAIHLQEAGTELMEYRDHLEISPENLAILENRLTKIHDVARKHHVTPEELSDVQKSLAQKISDLSNMDSHILELTETQKRLLKQYEPICASLTKARLQASEQLNGAMTDYMLHLGMTGGKFRVGFTPNEDALSPHGAEKVQFEVSTNPGQEFQILSKVVSGGELSRISLALQAILAKRDNTPTLIFDEVDVGIGGKTAEVVGQLLKKLGEKCQVFCITHLAQVASQGHHHYFVEKITENNETSTKISSLKAKERVQELARMLGGSSITKQALAHAKEMLIGS